MAICCSLVACGNNEIADNDTQTENQTTTVSDTPSNEAYALSKIVYDNIDIANEIISDYAGDIHEAWRLGIYDDDELLENGVALLASELSLSQEEIAYGIGYLACTMIIWDEEWTEETAQATKETFTPELANTIFSFMEDNMFSFCVEIVKATYLITGRVDIAQSALDTAKTQIKELSMNYSDYEHYPNLKGYYTAVSSLFTFCEDPEGSFDTMSVTINDYRSKIRDYVSELNYFFED